MSSQPAADAKYCIPARLLHRALLLFLVAVKKVPVLSYFLSPGSEDGTSARWKESHSVRAAVGALASMPRQAFSSLPPALDFGCQDG